MESTITFDNVVLATNTPLSNNIVSSVISKETIVDNVLLPNGIIFDLIFADFSVLGTIDDVLGTMIAFDTLNEDQFDEWEGLDDIGAWL